MWTVSEYFSEGKIDARGAGAAAAGQRAVEANDLLHDHRDETLDAATGTADRLRPVWQDYLGRPSTEAPRPPIESAGSARSLLAVAIVGEDVAIIFFGHVTLKTSLLSF